MMITRENLERELGVVFSDKSVLQRALTHRSYLNEHPESPFEDNERLEFLGDAVLDFVTAEYLYHRFPEMDEGSLTSLRSALVCRDTLASFGRSMDLGSHLLMGRGEEESGGRQRPATLCATFEAFVGALYLDQGLDPVRRLLEPLVSPRLERALRRDLDKDPKSQLQELVQGQRQCTPRYVTIATSGPDHAKEFTVEVTVGGVVLGRGRGHSKQQAAQAAAIAGLELLGRGEGDMLIPEDGIPGAPEAGSPAG